MSVGTLPPTTAHRALRSDTLADSVVIVLALTFVQRLVGFGRSILFCMWLEPEELGEWDIAFGFLLLAAPVAVLSLPGAFGRYVEYFRQRGQLRTFLKRITIATGVLGVTAAVLIALNRAWFSQLIFGRPDRTELVAVLAGSLLAVIAYNIVVELFIAMRLQRLASGVEFLNSMAFATLGIGLLLHWRHGAASVVAAFGGACLISAVVSLFWIWHSLRAVPRERDFVPQGSFWSKLIPFAASVWVSNWLVNLFVIIDRYMIIHHSGLNSDEALATVGQYHGSRIVPMLLVTVAGLVSSTAIPFLSHDWEAGRRRAVSDRLNLLLKLSAVALVGAAILVLFASPLLFGLALKGRFEGGRQVLSWTLMYSAWFGMFSIARTYFWCDERVRLVSIALVAGLCVNIGLNVWLLPAFGLVGAVWSTCGAHFISLVLVLSFARMRGMRIHSGTWMIMALPMIVCLGPWIASLIMIGVLILMATTQVLLNHEEKQELITGTRSYLQRIKRRTNRQSIAPAVAELQVDA
jgi:PST family polysaccharide transporter